MITVTNLAIQFGKKVLYKDVNLKSANWSQTKEQWRCCPANV